MQYQAQKRALLERLQTLGVRLEGIENELETPLSTDWEDRAVELEGEEVLESLGQQGQAEIARIKAALDRMASGDYGICTRCGNEISEERLEVLPETPLCKDCAAEA